MAQNKINIISFDVPSPPDYGGIIDVYYKIKGLNKAGYKVILHCFEYGRKPQLELEKICHKVYYYERKKGFSYLISRLPYIVITRKNKTLLDNIKKNDYPILFEGLHTCYFLCHPAIKGRQKLVRTHNIEHEYYNELAKASKNLIKRIYYQIESSKLRRFEKIIEHASCIAAISKNDFNHFAKLHGKVILLPAFHPYEKVTSKTGKGDYYLYHGNLAVEENEKAAIFLIKKVFSQTTAKLIIAGKSPSKRIQNAIEIHENIELAASPSEKQMAHLIQNAQGCILPTFQETGLKLKLLISLFTGRHLIANNAMINNTGLESLCKIANDEKKIVEVVNSVSILLFSEKEIAKREAVLSKFTNQFMVQKLITEINAQ